MFLGNPKNCLTINGGFRYIRRFGLLFLECETYVIIGAGQTNRRLSSSHASHTGRVCTYGIRIKVPGDAARVRVTVNDRSRRLARCFRFFKNSNLRVETPILYVEYITGDQTVPYTITRQNSGFRDRLTEQTSRYWKRTERTTRVERVKLFAHYKRLEKLIIQENKSTLKEIEDDALLLGLLAESKD